ncbi:hypothetical protein I3J27_07675 [Bradyrhizobium xenonodulans]|uniref:DUF2442 domain-containing protein n=1 Tax=Bradyrhizobium xenonodulans TaxID=2736875 RepID=A0ABY7MPH0_9BRAD|nr:hypothetical protein [Bradyrhizobium xenonodulans]WBL80293.1 hypothetical protein I3J27_07675 [Bradyrhizobium xenonodulans]
MTDLKNNAPRRYFVDAGGQRVLIGLSLEETFEFERLDSQSVANLEEVVRDGGVLWPVTGVQRWQELYAKHEGAWKTWIAQNRGERPAGFSLY